MDFTTVFYHPASPYISIMESCYSLNNMIMTIILGTRSVKNRSIRKASSLAIFRLAFVAIEIVLLPTVNVLLPTVNATNLNVATNG